jgi:hypothetical protein
MAWPPHCSSTSVLGGRTMTTSVSQTALFQRDPGLSSMGDFLLVRKI